MFSLANIVTGVTGHVTVRLLVDEEVPVKVTLPAKLSILEMTIGILPPAPELKSAGVCADIFEASHGAGEVRGTGESSTLGCNANMIGTRGCGCWMACRSNWRSSGDCETGWATWSKACARGSGCCDGYGSGEPVEWRDCYVGGARRARVEISGRCGENLEVRSWGNIYLQVEVMGQPSTCSQYLCEVEA